MHPIARCFQLGFCCVVVRNSQKLDHPLYAVHWVWGGRTMESKRQDMRDAMKFHDEPAYYSSPYLITFDLDQLKVGRCCCRPITAGPYQRERSSGSHGSQGELPLLPTHRN
jgi:hypothetical protein